ncbi:MAG TPA: hypothetical protein VFR90_14550 [Methylibium sp.]|uniref:hypothetical protein n=1 Tax=Methylibium sp. TaxID=2067992 RepID=UPI002DBF77EF|nr:hypothetical protein [Methylibium sp.]HEU4460337.1 hypothetical protein [Methylibium sp.]
MKTSAIALEAVDVHPIFIRARQLARLRVEFRRRSPHSQGLPQFGTVPVPEPIPPHPRPEPVEDDDMVPVPPGQMPGAPVREPGPKPQPIAIV